MFKFITVIFLGVFLIEGAAGFAQPNDNALSWRMNTAYNKYLMRDVHQQYAQRKERLTRAFSSKEAMIGYREDLKQRYRSIVGDFPKKAELNAKVLDVLEQDGFRIEKIIFESLPKRYVTANLYLPAGNGPFPAAVELCGHGLGGKIPASKAAILCARNGIAVLVVDPLGQGERIQFVDENSESLTRGATTEHTLLNQGANLLGSSLAAYEYWDNHNAIDYLVSRKDIDAARIGVYGSSGGGTQTSYMLGLDDRIQVASVCSYFSQRERVLELDGPSDGCQHVPYEGREQLELADFVLMMAPKPVLIMSGKYDFVDYWGATQAFDELEQAYIVLGAPEKVSLFSTEGGHGMPKPKREALLSWLYQWMFQKDTVILEAETAAISIEDLRCTTTGQINTAISDAVSIPQYHFKLAKEYGQNRSEFMKEDLAVVKDKVLELLGLSADLHKVRAESTGTMKFRNYDLYKYQLVRPGQLPVPCVVVYPENVDENSSVTLYLHEKGKSEILSDEDTVGKYVNNNEILLVADLRGFGETADPISLNDTKYWNREYRNAMTSMHIGKPIVGQRVTDIFSLLDFVGSDPLLKGRRIHLFADGAYGPVAIHAAFLDSRIEKTEVARSIKSYIEYLENPLQRDVYSNVLYGVLKYYDLGDLVQLSGNRIYFVD
jgi:cephalosporin-C deacetylase-like acetyl esterase